MVIWQIHGLLTSIWYWYWHCGLVYVFLLISGLATSAKIVRKSQTEISDMAKSTVDLKVLRKNGSLFVLHEINSEDLVPGDVIELKDEMSMPCDCVLLEGQVVMNES